MTRIAQIVMRIIDAVAGILPFIRKGLVRALAKQASTSTPDLTASLHEELELDSSTATVFAMVATNRAPSLEAGTPEEARKLYDKANDIFSLPASGVEISNIQVATKDGPALELRRYRPSGLRAPYPTTLFIHGGGWVIGSLHSHQNFCTRLAKSSGCQVLATSYPLAPEHPWPAGYKACYNIWREISAVAKEHPDILAQSLAVGGDSAGGSLSAMISAESVLQGGQVPCAQLLIYPALSLDLDAPGSHRRYASGFGLTASLMDWFVSHTLGKDHAKWKKLGDNITSLLNNAPDKQPPTLLVNAGLDPLLDDGLLYEEKLRQAGTPVTRLVYKGLPHNFINMTAIKQVYEAVESFSAEWGKVLQQSQDQKNKAAN